MTDILVLLSHPFYVHVPSDKGDSVLLMPVPRGAEGEPRMTTPITAAVCDLPRCSIISPCDVKNPWLVKLVTSRS
ncbi:hypothetical protein E2C01_002874 [Portunus trituberculatus]|uniref:Uncharacterized protein n=1 Tax=Portunus trituberculatus TaxID=210409 RepID=A0A5B7CKM1_PORTR|nr:hypothetical protein [Portunus trituberculatus]